MSRRRNIRDMVVVITGASAGIGKALAEMLAPRGAKLVLAARRADRLDALNAALGGNHLSVVTDVAKREDCKCLIASSIERFGRIDTLVCNAGYGYYRLVADTSIARSTSAFVTSIVANVAFSRDVSCAATPPAMLSARPRARIESLTSFACSVSIW